MNISAPDQLHQFFLRLSQRYLDPADIYVFGGSALLLSGGQRVTADIDYTTSTSAVSLRTAITELGQELGLDLEESVPEDFMPLPQGAELRFELAQREPALL